jgi:hypothetical protein
MMHMVCYDCEERSNVYAGVGFPLRDGNDDDGDDAIKSSVRMKSAPEGDGKKRSSKRYKTNRRTRKGRKKERKSETLAK